jgi:outer membrane protein assembly factor BamB
MGNENKFMKMTNKKSVVITAVLLAFLVVFTWWLADSFPYGVAERIPGMDNRPGMISETDTVDIGSNFDFFGKLDDSVAGSWPRFRGSDFDNIIKDMTPLAESWESSGPPVVWSYKLGEGYAAPVIHNGRVYILDYDEKKRADMLRCFSLKSGVELWRRWYNVALKRNHGMSRTIPAVTGDYLVTIGPKCHVMCVNPISGDLLWTIDMEKVYGTRIPYWYTGQCPLIDNNVAVLAPGGSSLMIGVDCATGNVLWQTPNPDSLQMSHSSVLPVTIHGKKMYMYNAIGGIVGISAGGEDLGKILWKNSEWNPAVIAPSPLHLNNNEIAVTTCYGAGGGKIRIEKNGNNYRAVLVEKHSPREGMTSDQQTPILIGDHVWSIMPKDAGELRNQLVCYHKSNLKVPVWTSSKDLRFGLGPYILRGNRLFLFNEDGELFIFRIDTGKAALLNRYKILEGTDAWGPLAFTSGYLLLRDSENLLCLNLGKANL